jgi:uncharacterized protein (TIGR03084 family)
VSEDTIQNPPLADPQMAAICDDLEDETAELLKLIVPLSPLHWDLATPAEGWSVRDAVSHLAFFDGTGNLAATDPEAFAATAKALMADPDPGAGGITKGRAMRPVDVLNGFIRARSEMIANFRKLDAKTRLPWYGPAMGALSFATARLMETWAHGQDIADALGATRPQTARLKHIAHIGVKARPYSYLVNNKTLPDADVAVRLKAPDGSTWSWNDAAAGTNLITGNALDFCLVVTQRRHRSDTGLVATGPAAEEWIAFAQAFAGGAGAGRVPGQFPSTAAPVRSDPKTTK